MQGSKNPQWKGDNVGVVSLHEWVRVHKPNDGSCEICGLHKPLEVANISGLYKRDINDFRWLCRSCHMKSDGRMRDLKCNSLKGAVLTFHKDWWTEDQFNFLVNNYKRMPYKDLSKQLGKSIDAIAKQLWIRKLNKNKSTRSSIEAHFKIVNGEKYYPCTCYGWFHNNNGIGVCPLCGKSFNIHNDITTLTL